MGWQEDLPEKSEEFFKEFGINLAKYYAIAIINKAQRKKSEPEDTRKLTYRPWDSVAPHPSSFMKGTVFMRDGDGAASWRAWRPRYLVQRPDSNFDVFNTDKDYEKAPDKPVLTINVSGYQLLSSTQEHYLQEGRAIAAELGGSDPEVGHSSYSWGLAHPTRLQYMFQLHKGKNPSCSCIGGNAIEPEDAGAEFSDQRDQWVAVFEACVAKACPRDPEGDLVADAFDRLKTKMINTIPELEGKTLDGTEGEILADMIYLSILEVSVKPEILENLEKLPPAFRYPAWLKAKAAGVKMIQSSVPPAWKKIQEQMSALNAKIEPTIMEKMELIFEVKEKIKSKIIEVVGGKMGEALGKHISPHLKPMFDALDAPLQDGIKEGRKLFEEKSNEAASKSGDDRKKYLDSIPRDEDNVKKLKECACRLTDPLQKLKKIDADVFQDLDPQAARASAEALMLEILDAACHSLNESLNAEGAPDFETCRNEVLANYDEDIIVQRATWMKTTINGIVINFFTRTVGSYADELIEPLTSEIPEDAKEFFDIKAEYDSIIYGSVSEAVNKFIDGAYQ